MQVRQGIPGFADRLTKLVKDSGKSFASVDKAIAPNQNCASMTWRWGKGMQYPNWSNLLLLAKHFNVSVPFLMYGTDNPERETHDPRG